MVRVPIIASHGLRGRSGGLASCWNMLDFAYSNQRLVPRTYCRWRLLRRELCLLLITLSNGSRYTAALAGCRHFAVNADEIAFLVTVWPTCRAACRMCDYSLDDVRQLRPNMRGACISHDHRYTRDFRKREQWRHSAKP